MSELSLSCAAIPLQEKYSQVCIFRQVLDMSISALIVLHLYRLAETRERYQRRVRTDGLLNRHDLTDEEWQRLARLRPPAGPHARLAAARTS
jgi:hypothetical protein